MRLDKLLSQQLNISRIQALYLIKDKKIKVNGKTITSNSLNVDPNVDIIHYLDQPIKYQKYHYLLINKPSGYICSLKDELYPSIMHLIKEPNFRKDLKIAGRLDADTLGALIITNDGDLIHFVTSPKSHIIKKYYCEYDKPLNKEHLDDLKNGIMLDGTLTNPIIIEIINEHSCYISISDGRYHEVKKIINYLDSEITFLNRISIGANDLINIKDLKVGEVKIIDISIIEELRKNG